MLLAQTTDNPLINTEVTYPSNDAGVAQATADARSSNLMGGILGIGIALLIIVVLIGTVILKGIALWRAGQNGHKGWFIAMYLINILGILEIIYLLTAGKKGANGKVSTTNSSKS